ncbi:glycoside hydrolase family 97 protein [Parabacteroides sp. PF5-9]|uniref:glycoside hydrolase family 97 protein n=1 Tax=Parabacteroides sp. PF5-9 TaxID=1742404 RepID=UPI0024765D57|nr:glycoside hydrolase family 97 protein [Parabacteroides sp. PF5-9]MDH6356150.1 alpha-glucosidase [Parabacteroides sp. PF5-9]
MKPKNILLLLIVLCGSLTTAYAQSVKSYDTFSPNGLIKLTVHVGDEISWEVTHGETRVILPSALSMTLSTGEILGEAPRVSKILRATVDTSFDTPFYKKSRVIDQYHQLIVQTRDNYTVEFRVYDEGVAYRFRTTRKGELTIQEEQIQFNFAADHKAYVPYINDMRGGERYTYSFESYYDEIRLSEMTTDSLAIVPLLVDLGNGKKAAVMEGDVEDYPGMFLLVDRSVSHGLKGAFAPYPLEGKIGGHNNLNIVPTKRADYIAKTTGRRSYPWRAVVISSKDTELADNDMMQKLAAPSRIKDMSWIKPGKVAWDWWNTTNLSHVDFKSGMNTPTYKYFIDFAAANKLEYIIIDEGWSRGSLMVLNPEIDLEAIIAHGKQKGVDVILWASWRLMAAEKDTVFPHYAAMGIKGFKVDFLDRDDQEMIRSMYEIARDAAAHKLLLDLHGMKATGIQRTYPNVVNFEGVKGLENFKWAPIINGQIRDDMPRYDVTIPFIRMLAGPLDYTPGAMKNATRKTYRSINDHPMSQGTRVHQMAMYTIYEAPLQMLADSPTAYMREQECTDFIAQVPTVFDETVVLSGEVGEYILMARRKGDVWYVGGMTNWTDRELNIDFSFLGSGSFEAEIFADGINADVEATDYKREVIRLSAQDKRIIKMAPAGGWSARISPVGR